jgi:hypothetical protein
MALVLDIVRSLRAPRRVIRALAVTGPREPWLLMVLMLACALVFVAQWPRLARAAQLDPSIPLDARLAGALFAWVFIAPLFFYGMAALMTLALRIVGRVPGARVRLALFWALMVASPFLLLQGLVAGVIGPGLQAGLVALVAAGVFLAVLVAGLRVAVEEPAPAA